MTSKLLLEAGYSRFQYLWAGFGQVPPDGLTNLIPVTEQSTMYGQANYNYRGLYDPLGFAFADNDANPNNWRATASYVTGAHSMKAGYQGSFQKSLQGRVANQTQMRYRFNNGVPNAVGYYLAPRWEQNDRTAHQSLFVQDQWTRDRLTVQGGLRFDHAWSWAPAEHNGTSLTSRFNPAADQLPAHAISVLGYNDITPRVGAAYDVFGNGKTAVKVNVGKYLQAATNDENYWANNPAGRIVTSRARARLGRRQRQLRGRLRSVQPGGAEQPGHRRRQLRGAHGQRPEFRQLQPQPDDGQSRDPARAGASVRTTGSSARRFSRNWCRACR